MIFSISPRCGSERLGRNGRDAGERDCGGAEQGGEAVHCVGPWIGRVNPWSRAEGEIGPRAARRLLLQPDDVVGLDPAGRSGRKPRLGARRKLARGLGVAAASAACAEAIGFGIVALAAVRHGKLGVDLRRVRLALHRDAQQRDRLVGVARIAGRDQRLAEHDADQRRVRGERGGAAQRRDRVGGPRAFEQALALQLVEIRVVRLRLDQRVDLRIATASPAKRCAAIARAHSGPPGWCRSSGSAARPNPAARGNPRAWRASGRGAAAIRADRAFPSRDWS